MDQETQKMTESQNLNGSNPEELETTSSTEVESVAENGDTATETAAEETGKEQSTIFQKHIYEDKAPMKKGNKKRALTCIIAIALCVAIASSVFLVIKLVPNESGSSPNSSTVDYSVKLLDYDEIVKPSTVEINGEQVEVDNNIKSVSIYNHYESYSFAPYYEPAAEKSTSSTASSDKKTYLYDTKWKVNGIDTSLTENDTIAKHIKTCLTVTAMRVMENTFDTLEEYYAYYGLDESTRGFTVEFTDSEEDLVVIVGDQLPSKDANYVTVSGDEKVYAVSSDYIKNYDYLPVDFADMTVVDKLEKTDENSSYFNSSDELARFDYINISGKIFGDDVLHFEMSEGPSADFMPYTMKTPYNRPVDETFIESILTLASDGIEASRLYTFNGTAENQKLTALDDPACVIELKIGEYYFKLTVGGTLQENSTSLPVMADDRPQIFTIDASCFDFITTDYTKLFNSNIIMENIYTLDKVTIKDSTGNYTFDLTHTPVDGSEDVFNTTVMLGNTELKDKNFKSLYHRVLMLSLLDFSLEEAKADPILSVTFDYIDGYETKLLEFTVSPRDSYHCVAWVNGQPLGEVLKSSVDDIIKNLETLVSGGDVPESF